MSGADLEQSEKAQKVEGRAAASAALAALSAGGLDLTGALDVAEYDSLSQRGWRSEHLLSNARSVLIVGSAGRSLGRAVGVEALARSMQRNPLDDHCRAVLDRAAALVPGPGRALFYTDRLGPDGQPAPQGEFVDLIGLAQAAGLGRPGRLRLLLHPELGPWLSIRGLLMSRLDYADWLPSTGPAQAASVGPTSLCDGCPAPCVTACPGGALDAGPLDLERCSATRLANRDCERACAARRACVLGREHAYERVVEAHHARASFAYLRAGENGAHSES